MRSVHQISCAKPALGGTLCSSVQFLHGVFLALSFDVVFLLLAGAAEEQGADSVARTFLFVVAMGAFTFVVSYVKLPPLPSKVWPVHGHDNDGRQNGGGERRSFFVCVTVYALHVGEGMLLPSRV